MFSAGPKNALTDVEGLLVGNAHDANARTGVTVVRPVDAALAAVDVRGGAPGGRETAGLDPACLVDHVNAVVLSGGSAFGLDAAGTVMKRLADEGAGFMAGPHCVPIVPQAILFDLSVGRDRSALSYAALADRAFNDLSEDCPLGSVGAGYGATTATLAGGLGSASTVVEGRFTVSALAAVNAVGSVTIGDGPHFHAADFELGDEFGGQGRAPMVSLGAAMPPIKGFAAAQNTIICVLATDLALPDVGHLQRLAIMAHDGLARAVYPSHAPTDGDTIFALTTGDKPVDNLIRDLSLAGAAAISTMARAVARGVYSASNGFVQPTWQSKFGMLG